MSNLSGFTLFHLLPKEIRLQIWRTIAMTPRLIEINVAYTPKPRHTPPPAVLHVNYESRSCCIKYYTLSFTTSTHPGVYLNFAVDTISFSTPKLTLEEVRNFRPRPHRYYLRRQMIRLLTFNLGGLGQPDSLAIVPNHMREIRYLRLSFYHDPDKLDWIWSDRGIGFYSNLEHLTLMYYLEDDKADETIVKWRETLPLSKWRGKVDRPTITFNSIISGNEWRVIRPDEDLELV